MTERRAFPFGNTSTAERLRSSSFAKGSLVGERVGHERPTSLPARGLVDAHDRRIRAAGRDVDQGAAITNTPPVAGAGGEDAATGIPPERPKTDTHHGGDDDPKTLRDVRVAVGPADMVNERGVGYRMAAARAARAERLHGGPAAVKSGRPMGPGRGSRRT